MAKRRRRSNPDSSSSDIDTTDLTQKALPGFAAYGATRLVSRMAFSIAEKRQSPMSRHVAVGAGLAVAAAAWGFGGRLKQTKEFYEPILIGAGIAAAQSAVQAYLPKYGWLVGDLPVPGAGRLAAGGASSGPSLADLMKDDDLEVVPLLLPGQTAPGTSSEAKAAAQNQEDFLDAMGDYNEMNDVF